MSDEAINISATIGHLWTLDSALEQARPLEKLLEYFNGHLALGGSVLYQGWSDNDLDLFIYPHSGKELDRTGLFGGLIACGWTKPERCGKNDDVRYPESREIYETAHNGRKINLFFFQLDK